MSPPTFLELDVLLERPILLFFIPFASILLKPSNLWEVPGHTSDTRENTQSPTTCIRMKTRDSPSFHPVWLVLHICFVFCKRYCLLSFFYCSFPASEIITFFVSNTQGTRGSQKIIFRELILFLPWIQEQDWGGQAFTASAVPLSCLTDPVDTLVLKFCTWNT